MRRSRPAPLPITCAALIALSGLAGPAHAEEPLGIEVELGPIAGAASERRTIAFNAAARTKRTLHDAQDGQQHAVRGVALADLLAQIKRPKSADTAVFVFTNGMQVPVRLADKAEIDQLFVAFEHADPLGAYSTKYPLVGSTLLDCPKLVYRREGQAYTIWRYTSSLRSIRLVTWSSLQAVLAQPTRQLPSHPGWKLYAQHCQACHGLGGNGATRAPDFVSDLDAYRRIPPLLETAAGEAPSLHDKVKGRAGGQMPSLDHVSRSEIATLWRWLHSVHAGATK